MQDQQKIICRNKTRQALTELEAWMSAFPERSHNINNRNDAGMRKVLWLLGCLPILSFCPSVVVSSGLSDIVGINVNFLAGTITFGPPRPDRIPAVLQNLPKDAAIYLLNPYAGTALAAAIRQAKEAAKPNCVPIPETVKTTLGAFFPSDVFNGVCWAVVGNSFTLDSFAIHDAGMGAITLEDVVIFRSSQDGLDPVLWAHELTHVQQYRSLGVEGFAALYSVAWSSVEQQARDFDQFVTRSLQGALTANQTFWVTSNGWSGRRSISFQQYSSAAKQISDPSQCSSYRDVVNPGFPYYTEVINSCPIPITVSAVSKEWFNGYKSSTPCNISLGWCTIAAGQSQKYPTTNDSKTTAVIVSW